MGYPQEFCACNTFNGEILPNQGNQFGIPYNICPRQTFGRVVTDLNTQELCQNLCPKLTTDRASSPKVRKDCSTRAKSPERKPLARSAKCTTNKKPEGLIKTETTSASLAQNKTKSSEKPLTLKKEQESSEDGNKGIPKVKSENVTVSDVVTSKAVISDADPSKLCSEEKPDESKVRMYHDYLNLYKQENSKSELEGRSALHPIPTYTRMPGKDEVKTEVDQKPTIKQPADSPPFSDSDRIKDQVMGKGNSKEDQEVQETKEDPCCCDAGQNTLQGQSSTDERIISTQDYCCCDVFEGGNTGDHNQDSHVERTAHHQLTDVGSPSSSPESGPVHSYKERRPAHSHGRCDEEGYSSPGNLKQQADNRYFDDARPVASWNYINIPTSHDDRIQHNTGSAPKVSRMHSQQSNSYRCKDKDSTVIKQERREFSKERVLIQAIPKEKRNHSFQRSPSRQDKENTSYASFAPQYQKGLSEMQVQRKAGKTQQEFPCHEQRPMQTKMQPRIEKASEQHYRKQVNPTPPNPSRIQNSSSDLMVSSQCESAETIVKNPNQQIRNNYNDNEINDYSPHDRFVNSNHMKQHTSKKFEPQENSPRYRSDYGHVYDESNYEALDCRQDDLRQPSYRIPRETQKSHDNSSHVSYKQTIPSHPRSPHLRQHSPRNPKDSYRQVSQKPWKEYNSQKSPAEDHTRSQSPNRNYRANDQSSSSHSYLDHSQSDYQCSECQETYKTLEQIQDMRRNVDHYRTYNNDRVAREPRTEYSSFPDQIDFEYDRYNGKQLKNPVQVYNQRSPRSCMSSPRHSSPVKDGQVPLLETVCEKRTRTVTFEDDSGDLTKEEHMKETCRSLIDWERAVKYHMVEQDAEKDNTDDNYTCSKLMHYLNEIISIRI